ncbi:unnamed protein product [Vicia faba]|uniref:No apical meristem-associated C-terminal domain-containing protein n=1 Tax=Vicia faba TaxID=3906 RepID=A0AAV0YEN6_VICFA|nr:unnamed protein product [Vicia faba]
MDPNHFHYQQAMFNFMQNYQNPNSQNSRIPSVPPNSAIFFPSPNNPNMYQNPNPQNSQVPPFSTQVGVEKEERVLVKKKSREQLQGMRIYVLSNHGSVFQMIQLQDVNGKKSGTSENDIMAAVHAFYAQDQGTTFNLEYAWRLLKDEAKWGIIGESIGNSSKMTQTSASGASSEIPDTPSSYGFNSSSPMERPMGQKAAKRKSKAKKISNATQDARNKRAETMERLAQSKEDEIELKVMQIMMKDTSTMNESQRDIHEKYCNKMKRKKYAL